MTNNSPPPIPPSASWTWLDAKKTDHSIADDSDLDAAETAVVPAAADIGSRSGIGRVKSRRLSTDHRLKSSITLTRIDRNDPMFRGEDPAMVDIACRRIELADKNLDGQLDIYEVAETVLGAVKDAQKASKKEKQLKRMVAGLAAFLGVFALIFLVVQGASLGRSIEEGKITSVNADTYGNAHLQDKSGNDLSTRSHGDTFRAESKLDLYSGRMLQCVPVEDVAAMVNDAANGVDASVLVSDAEGVPTQAVSVGRAGFDDQGSEVRFGDGKVTAILDSDACETASADPQVDNQGGGRKLKAASSSAVVLARNRDAYRKAMKAFREEGHRSLTGGGAVPVVGPWTAAMCADMPDDDANTIQAAIDAIACPAMRFLVKKGLDSGLFDICGYGGDDYLVDTASMKNLISSGVQDFPGLKFDQVITNDDNLSVFHRAFSGAVDSQAVGVVKHVDTQQCLNIETENPSTTSPINLSTSCSGSSQRFKFLNSKIDASIQIYHRSSYGTGAATEYCLSATGTGVGGVGVELKRCADAGNLAKWSPPDSLGRIKKWGEEGCLNVAGGSITVEACTEASSQAWTPPPIFNAADIELNFDHAASTGIIGSATTTDTSDNDGFNQDKYNLVLTKLCNECDINTLDSTTTFTEADFGRVVNHAGSNMFIHTEVGPFSWAVLTFEYSNFFAIFKKDGVLPLATFEKLFLPNDQLIAKGYLAAGDIVPDIDRDVIGAGQTHDLRTTIAAMNIQISCAVKGHMVDALNACDSSLPCAARSFDGLFTDLCGAGYANCLVDGGCP